MSALEKQLMKLMSLPMEMRYDEIKNLLERYGFVGYEVGSSHITFRKKGYMNITLPRHGKIKRTYLRIVRNVVLEVINNEK